MTTRKEPNFLGGPLRSKIFLLCSETLEIKLVILLLGFTHANEKEKRYISHLHIS